MQPERPMDDDDDQELLDKVDALLKRHQPKRYVVPPGAAAQPEPEVPAESLMLPEPPPAALTEPAEIDIPAFDDIPLLTDIVDEQADLPAPPSMPLPGELLLNLEERLYRELEAHVAPQLSMAFGKALTELLSQAKILISEAVREHLAQELQNQKPEAEK